MLSIQFEIEYVLEGADAPAVVTADQRDYARYELQDFYDPQVPRRMTMIRYLAYSAAVRAGQTKLSWPQFNDKCLEARDPRDDDAVDPTRRGASAEGS